MQVVQLTDLEDSRLDAYRDIRHRNWTYVSPRFIAEGPLLVQRLLASTYEVESVLVDVRLLDQYQPLVPAEVPILAIPHNLVEQLVGFNFHRGVLACGIRKPALDAQADFGNAAEPNETMIATVGVQDPENLGTILRCCAGFGIQRVIIGPGTADPLARRVMRVSMGNVLRLKILRCNDLIGQLQWLREFHRVTSYATSLTADSQPLESIRRSGPALILLGNERLGLPENVQAAADKRVKIEMALGTDSLNVSVAAAITMYYLARIAK